MLLLLLLAVYEDTILTWLIELVDSYGTRRMHCLERKNLTAIIVLCLLPRLHLLRK